MPHILDLSPLRTFHEISDVGKREAPKINGSEGGFIALIVCLVVVIVVSCIAVFFLLRNHEPSEQDRTYRQRNRRHQHQSMPVSSDFTPQPATKLGWSSLFHGGTSEKNGRNDHTRGGHGWVQAGSGEWDSEDDVRGGIQRLTIPEMGEGPWLRSPPIAASARLFDAPPFRPPTTAQYSLSDSTSSVHFDTRRSGSMYSPVSPVPVSVPMMATRIPPSPVSSPLSSPIPIRSMSPEPIPGSVDDTNVLYKEERKESGQSGVSVWTFEGGTKFIESL